MNWKRIALETVVIVLAATVALLGLLIYVGDHALASLKGRLAVQPTAPVRPDVEQDETPSE